MQYILSMLRTTIDTIIEDWKTASDSIDVRTSKKSRAVVERDDLYKDRFCVVYVFWIADLAKLSVRFLISTGMIFDNLNPMDQAVFDSRRSSIDFMHQWDGRWETSTAEGEGVRGFYKGYLITLASASPFNSIIWTLLEDSVSHGAP